jgi:diguanylate cyclase (GGDEF)-like protein/putative nucleotidyltransferase with HDIG domain
MPKRATIFIALTATFGAVLMLLAIYNWHSPDYLRFGTYLAMALVAAGLKVVLPGTNTSVAVGFLFILLGVVELSLPEVMIIALASTLAQCLWKMSRPAPFVRIIFNVFGVMAPATWVCYWVYSHAGTLIGTRMPLRILVATCAFFLANTLPIAAIITLAEGRPFRKTWTECYFWSFPCYLAGAALVCIIHYVDQQAGWQAALLSLPVVYWIYRSYRIYLERLEDEMRHVENIAALQLRTIEALALAIDAKDRTTHEHLQRVRIYALEIGKEMGLAEPDLEALKAAAILHDIGKLAVPEHIISKPGRLTPEEFEKMKIHPVVGAEILERVNFPYPVVPIVRAHHEKWDGSGYPDGLAGEDIPIGARILSAVDCLDALASDRQYRRALPLDQAMEYVASLAGKEFDRQVVDILKRRYLELEQLASSQPSMQDLSFAVKSENLSAPAAGFAKEPSVSTRLGDCDFLSSIAAARQEAQMLFELTHVLGNSLSLDETLSVVSARLRKLVPYDSIVIWIRENGILLPKHVSGDEFRLFSSLKIQLGQGLSGWVVENAKPILNGNPLVEPGYLNDSDKSISLRSALSVPLEGLAGVIGALTIYRLDADSFSRDDLRILLAISAKIALSIENALKFQQIQTSATTDYMTGLPNAGSLFLQLERELARCQRTGSTLAVMVCDLNRFKDINDVYGHLEGNKVLRAFAEALKEKCREYDYVARMGGDEFVIVAPGLTPAAAKHKAELISQLARRVGQDVCGVESDLSASVGVAFSGVDGGDAEQLLAEADRHMYAAKRALQQQSGIPAPLPTEPAITGTAIN